MTIQATGERRQASEDEPAEHCAFCLNRPKTVLWLALPTNVLAELRVCNAHAVAMQMGHWTLTVRTADMQSAVRGVELD